MTSDFESNTHTSLRFLCTTRWTSRAGGWGDQKATVPTKSGTAWLSKKVVIGLIYRIISYLSRTILQPIAWVWTTSPPAQPLNLVWTPMLKNWMLWQLNRSARSWWYERALRADAMEICLLENYIPLNELWTWAVSEYIYTKTLTRDRPFISVTRWISSLARYSRTGDRSERSRSCILARTGQEPAFQSCIQLKISPAAALRIICTVEVWADRAEMSSSSRPIASMHVSNHRNQESWCLYGQTYRRGRQRQDSSSERNEWLWT